MSNCPLLLTFLRGTLRKDSSGAQGKARQSWGSRALWLISTVLGGPGARHHLWSSQHQCGPGGSKGRACASGREVLTMWPPMASLGASSCHLDAFFWSHGGHLPRPTCAQVCPSLRGFVWFLWGRLTLFFPPQPAQCFVGSFPSVLGLNSQKSLCRA